MLFDVMYHILDRTLGCSGGWQIELMIYKNFCAWCSNTIDFTLQFDYSQHLMIVDLPLSEKLLSFLYNR